ncbi:hypothetical protein D3C75_875910 [compost metagenome]
MDGMGCRKPAALKAEAGQQDVGLNNILQCRGNDVLITGQLCFDAILQQGFVAYAGQRQRGFGSFGFPAHPFTDTAGEPCIHIGEGSRSGPGFKIGGQSVPHARHQEPRRGFGDDGCINHDHGGALLEISVVVKSAFRRIKDRRMAGRSVCCGNGGNDD